MATTTTPSPCKETKAKTPPPPAKCCTSIECIEKPRFFCGQLLTDLDLETAMSYVSAKSRLHNRHLFGAGVVCGLTVTCDPCNSGSVIVESGYALDCLGNDIVVCAPAVFNVKEALDCKRKKEEVDCNSKRIRIPKECETPETEYCLVISYEEKPSKPVNALAHDQGCRGTGRCESSRTLETYRLDLLDEKSAKEANVFPDAWSRIRACLHDDVAKMTAFTRELAAVEKMDAARTAEALPGVYGRLRAAILEHAERVGLTHCDLIDKVCAIDKKFRLAQSDIAAPVEPPEIPAVNAAHPAGSAPATQTHAPARALLALYVQLLIDCVCAALQMPCGECCEPEHVLLACLKVRDGHVVSICNTVRTQVISGLSVRYWLQPLFGQLQEVIERLCCEFEPAQLVREEAGFAAFASKQSQASVAAKLAGRYATSLFEQLKTAATPASVRADALPSALDLYQQTADDARERLVNAGIKVVTITPAETDEEAYSVENLSKLAFKLQRDSAVELIVGPDHLVSAIRVVKGRP